MNWDAKTVARVFNSNILNDIANGNLLSIEEVSNNFFNKNLDSLNDFFESAFNYLATDYQNEYYYKNLIANKIFLEQHSLEEATMLTEFRVGLNKADCVILNGKSTCYEIKTDYDSLLRLEEQLNSYIQIFDEVYVVCSSKFVEPVLDIVPAQVGVLVLTDNSNFNFYKKAKKRSFPVNKDILIQSLRQKEYLELAEILSNKKISVPNTLIYKECLSVLQSCEDYSLINKNFIEILKKYRKNNARLIENLPKSLTCAAIGYRFNKKQIISLMKYFNNEEELNVLSNSKREV